MAFVKMKRGNDIKRVPESVSQYYKRFGYRIVDENKKNIRTPDDVSESDISEGTSNVGSIPISEMTKDQLREFAEMNDIDTSKARNIREARDIIRHIMKERKM